MSDKPQASGSDLRSGKTRLTQEEVKRNQEEKRRIRQEKLNNPRRIPTPEISEDSEDFQSGVEPQNVDEFVESAEEIVDISQYRDSSHNRPNDESSETSEEFQIKRIEREESIERRESLDRELSATFANISFTDQQGSDRPTSSLSLIEYKPSLLTAIRAENESFTSTPIKSENPLDTLNSDANYIHLRQSLLQQTIQKRNMAPPDQIFPIQEFYKSIPEYSGAFKELQHFISCCDYIFDTLNDANKAQFFRALVRKLKDKAFNLYHNKQWADWPEFRAALKKYFTVAKSFETFQLELGNVRQGRDNIQSYSQRIEDILYEMNTIGKDIKIENVSGERYFRIQNEKLALKAFLNGLNSPLKVILKARKYETLDDAIKDAIELEADEKLNNRQSTSINSNNYSQNTSQNNDYQNNQQNNWQGKTQNNSQNGLFCRYCKRNNHSIEQCFRRKNNNANNNSNSNSNYSGQYRGYNNNQNFNAQGNSNYPNNQNTRNFNAQSGSNNSTNNANNQNNQNFNRNQNQGQNQSQNQNQSRNQGNQNSNNNNSNRVRFVKANPKNDSNQTATMDNADLNFLLN